MSDGVRILVVDDDPDVRFATARVLKSGGYEILDASSGSECLEAVRKHRPDLIMLDVVMPDADGRDVCRIIKRDPDLKGTYVILTSGTKMSSDEQAEGLDGGADGYIVRTVSNRELLARVHAMVRILKAERERDRAIGELQEALATVKTLSGLLPVCSHCKKIRDDDGYWRQIEVYIKEHSSADFSHSICPDCAKEHFPEYDLDDN